MFSFLFSHFLFFLFIFFPSLSPTSEILGMIIRTDILLCIVCDMVFMHGCGLRAYTAAVDDLSKTQKPVQ